MLKVAGFVALGWLAHGWLLSLDGSKRPFPGSCMVETSYESTSITLSDWRDDGEWMRVRVFQPSNYCVGREDWQGLEHEGWVRWRDEVKGPWVFIWSRGC